MSVTQLRPFSVRALFIRLPLGMIAIPLIISASPATRGIAREYQATSKQERRVERGSRIVVQNEFGSIRIAGWDRDIVQAIATAPNSSETVEATLREESLGSKRILTVATVAKERPVKGRIDLEVRH